MISIEKHKAQLLVIHKISSRLLACLFVFLWYDFYMEQAPPEQLSSYYALVLCISWCIVLNLGLWLSSVKFGAKYRFSVSILMVPSLIVSPFFAESFFPFLGYVSLIVVVCSYWITLERFRLNEVTRQVI